MLIWPIVILVFVLLSMIQHLGIIGFGFLMDPWDKIILDIILLFIVLGIVYRIFMKSKKREKETLMDRMKGLEDEIKRLKGVQPGDQQESNQ
jgi:uncharacterized protein YqhQ